MRPGIGKKRREGRGGLNNGNRIFRMEVNRTDRRWNFSRLFE